MPLKVDFGEIFSGIILLLIGVVLLVIWVVVAVISIFIPVDASASTALLIIALVGIISGIIQILHGISGWRELGSRKKP